MTARWPFARVLAHRGGGTLAPENTIAAIKVGIEHGYRAIEFDAMLAADEVPVLMHDPTLERTGLTAMAVSEASASDLARIDVGRWHSPQFTGETVPTLQQTLRFCREHGVWPNVEIKSAKGLEALTGEAVARVTLDVYTDVILPGGDRAAGADARVPLFSSFASEALAAARAVAPDVPRGWLVQRVPANWRDQLQRLGCVALHTDHRYLTAELAREIRESAWLFVYTVNTVERARVLFDWGVDALCTDRIDLIPPDFGRTGRRGSSTDR
jgi:glycerophosphoryl diester phosphodiesterase